MTDTQRHIIEIAWDKTLSFGCIILLRDNEYDLHEWRITWLHYSDYVFTTDIWVVWEAEKIVWHPIHFWHLMKLNKESQNSLARWLFDKILNRFNNNLHLYSQDCLSWDEEINQLILNYLLTVKWK